MNSPAGKQPTPNSLAWFVCVGPTGHGEGATSPNFFSHPGGTICNKSQQFVFTCTSSASPQLVNTRRRTIVLNYNIPLPQSLAKALQLHTTTRSPPDIDINTCTELWTRLGSLSVINIQVRHGTDTPLMPNGQTSLTLLRANNPPWTHLPGLFRA